MLVVAKLRRSFFLTSGLQKSLSFSRTMTKLPTASDLIKCADDSIHQPFKDCDDTVARLCDLLRKAPTDCRIKLIRHLAGNHAINVKHLKELSSRFATGQNDTAPGDDIIAAKRLTDASLPGYKYLFEKIARNGDGMKLLVDARATILEKLLNPRDRTYVTDAKEYAELQFMSDVLRELFMLWFSPALLQLQRLSWDSTPASLLESVALSPAVHPIKDWQDLKRRLHDNDRRCFVFTHPSLSANQPVIILYVALMPSIPSGMREILGVSAEDSDGERLTLPKSAIFYSITSQNKGLNGIDLGHSLVRSVLGHLRSEAPHLSEFSTLSPVPKFLSWLQANEAECRSRNIPQLAQLQDSKAITGLPGYMQNLVRDFDPSQADELKTPLLRLAAKYLFGAKHRGFALDPVAHFHLRNGAEIYRINWLGDTSEKGLQQSASIMVNYRYWPERLEKNAQEYAVNRKIAISRDVEEMLD